MRRTGAEPSEAGDDLMNSWWSTLAGAAVMLALLVIAYKRGYDEGYCDGSECDEEGCCD